jgi:ABC-2 type transport system permease protein
MTLPRTLIIAAAEFEAAVRSKAFLIGLLAVPVLMGAAFLLQTFAGQRDTSERALAVVDYTGVLAKPLMEEARLHNARQVDARGRATGPQFLLRIHEPDDRPADAVRADLSEAVKRKALFAFVELPEDILPPGSETRLRYYSEYPTYQPLPEWLATTTTRLTADHRVAEAGGDPEATRRLLTPVRLDRQGLVERNATGTIVEGQPVDTLRTFALPLIAMFMLFGLVMSSAPQLLNSVIEEKTSRISEVLLGSVPAFTLMLGKLLGSVAVTLVLAAIYVGGGLLLAAQYDYLGAINWMVVPWFVVFLVLAILLFGSMFIAVGAACSEVKDAQGMMLPVLVLGMFPAFLWFSVVQNPDSTYSAVVSMIPFAAPYLMLLRIAIPPGPPAWQLIVALILVLATTGAMVYTAGRILRVGLLMQGKTATYREMIRWVRVS